MIRVLVVDDSPVVRSALQRGLAKDGDISVCNQAGDPIEAMEIMKNQAFDVMILDAEMPRMDGLTFLKQLQGKNSVAVVMCSSLARRSPEFVLTALRSGAAQVVQKPHSGYTIHRMFADLRTAVRSAAAAPHRSGSARTNSNNGRRPGPTAQTTQQASSQLLAVGASTGGIQAFEKVLAGLPADGPGIVVAQHLPVGFVERYAERLNSKFPHTVQVAQHDCVVRRGSVHIAPSTHHLEVRGAGAAFRTQLVDRGRVNHHKPSVDVLFQSVARSRATAAVAVLLTGMGRDGAQGLRDLKAAGATTICQDEKSCAVFGMPRAAIELGAASEVVGLNSISARIVSNFRPQ